MDAFSVSTNTITNIDYADTLIRSFHLMKAVILDRYGSNDHVHFGEMPDPEVRENDVVRLLSYRIRKKAKRRHVSYSFLFMRPNGDQLREIASLIDSGIIRPAVDRIFPFESTKEALIYVEMGRAKGKVVVKVR